MGKKAGKKGTKGDGKKKETGLRLTAKKDENFSEWYQQVIKGSEMIDSYPIRGCYILRPWAFNIWEHITEFFDSRIKKLGVKNAYFPLFVSRAALEAEEGHIEGFAPEVAWVTKSGSSDLAEPIAIRPTSETIMYPAFAKWVHSHRDLPIQLNQWTNVVRWEFKHPTPFIRTREFLWQEGHSAFATQEEADHEVLQILDLYARVYEELLAVPVVKGRKSEREKFPGGSFTTTVEAFVPASGRSIQAATSHSLGQTFAEMFDIKFEDRDGCSRKVWQNSWGLSTRSLGVVVMVHGDDKGLVLPPRASPLQVVIVPIIKSDLEADVAAAIKNVTETAFRALRAADIRVELDDREDRRPGWKYNHWERKGVPLRLEVGPRDAAANQVFAARRDTGAKQALSVEGLTAAVAELLETIQSDMLERARERRDACLSYATDWKAFMKALNKQHQILAPWCQAIACEEDVRERSGPKAEEGKEEDPEAAKKLSGSAKTLCIPFGQEELPEGTTCFACDAPASTCCLWGRSY